MRNTDFRVVGGGIIGLTIARELQCRNPSASVIILDKKTAPGQNASGRNSGFLHSGFNFRELFDISTCELQLFVSNHNGFR